MLIRNLVVGSLIFALPVLSSATPVSYWDSNGWIQFANDDGFSAGGFVDPGFGGQSFDAEYLYYRLQGDILSIGLQTGFDIEDGLTTYGSTDYYTGDIAISFDDDASAFEYAIDFGLLTRDYSGDFVDADNNGDGIDAAGLYSVSQWNNDTYFTVSNPFAMDEGVLQTGLLSNVSGFENDSYYRAVSFDISSLGLLGDVLFIDAHWTMSCGNDAVDGHVEVPEPASLLMLALALLLIPVAAARKKLK